MTGVAHVQMRLLVVLKGKPATTLTVNAMAKAAGLPMIDAQKAAAKLKSRGLLTRPEKGHYCVTNEGLSFLKADITLKSGPKAKLTGARRQQSGTQRHKIWQLLRTGKAFTLNELAALSAKTLDDPCCSKSNVEHSVDHQNQGRQSTDLQSIGRYITYLVAAGLVRRFKHRAKANAITSNGYRRYRLVHDLGPKVPVVRYGGKMLYDPNMKAEIAVKTVRAA